MLQITEHRRIQPNLEDRPLPKAWQCIPKPTAFQGCDTDVGDPSREEEYHHLIFSLEQLMD